MWSPTDSAEKVSGNTFLKKSKATLHEATLLSWQVGTYVTASHSPVIVFLAVDASILAEAGELGLQIEFALTAFQTAHVPLFVYGKQVIAVGYFSPAARTQSYSFTAHRRQALSRNTIYRLSKDWVQPVQKAYFITLSEIKWPSKRATNHCLWS